MPNLTEEQKVFIIQRLACYRSPQEVADEVKEEFGVEILRQHVNRYNPLQVRIAKKWHDLWQATREKYLNSIAEIGIAQKVWRLDMADHSYRKTKNPARRDALLEYAAKEMGGAFTNTRQVSGHLSVSVDEILQETDAWEEKRKEMMRERRRKKIEK